MKAMSHRERVLAALDRRTSDRVPIDLSGVNTTGIHVAAYRRFLDLLGIREEKVKFNPRTFLAEPSESVLQMIDVDCRGLLLNQPPDSRIGEHQYVDMWGICWERHEGTHFLPSAAPLHDPDLMVDDLAGHPWPDPSNPSWYRGIEEGARALREGTDCAVVLNLPFGPLRDSMEVRGFTQYLTDLIVAPDLAIAILSRVVDVVEAVTRRVMDLVGSFVDLVVVFDDLGFQDRGYMRREHYQEIVKPQHARVVRAVKEHSNARFLLHSDGSIRIYLPDLIEIGVDGINPVQTTAAGMDAAELKREFGDRLCFWGAVDTQHVLPFGSPEDVREEVRRKIRDLATGGGYVGASCHNMLEEVPAVNIKAMFDAFREFGVAEGRAAEG